MKRREWIIFWALFCLCICVIVRFSDAAPLYKNSSFLEALFKRPKHSSGIELSLATGYLVSALFFIIVVYLPDKRRTNYVNSLAIEDLSSVCADAEMLIVSMYKNTCTAQEWSLLEIDDDKDFFDESFFKRMKKFDGYAIADSLLMKRDADGKSEQITWDDKILECLESINSRLQMIVSQYAFLLDEGLLKKINSFRNNRFSVAFLGLPTNSTYLQYTDVYGQKYAERISFYIIRKDPSGKKTPIFDDSAMCNNSLMLEDYVNTLLELRKVCVEHESLRKDIAIQNYCRSGCGKTCCAIYIEGMYDNEM